MKSYTLVNVFEFAVHQIAIPHHKRYTKEIGHQIDYPVILTHEMSILHKGRTEHVRHFWTLASIEAGVTIKRALDYYIVQ